MQAFAIHESGAAPELHELPVPEPGVGEVRVRVTAASVNGFDLAVAAGYMAPYFEYRFPVVIGRDFAGTVDAVGPGIEGFTAGDRVFGVVSRAHLADGTFAEFTTVPVISAVTHTPDGLSDLEAAALGHTGTTALACLDAIDLPGATVLIVGATGGVGTLAIQLAARAGARVIATGRTEAGRRRLAGLGAEPVDYTGGLAGPVHALAPDGVDAAIHLAGDPQEIAPLVRDGGVFVSPILMSAEQLGDERLEFAPIAAYPDQAGLASLAELAASGELEVLLDRQYPLHRVHEATGAWGRSTLGNLIVTND